MLQNFKYRYQSDSTVDKALVMHTVLKGLIPSITYGAPELPSVILIKSHY